MAKILEGLWDCPYCKTKGIGGLTKHCPCCGHPQDDDTQFYMGTEKRYLDAELAVKYGKGADWVCPYCGSLNRHHYEFCANCAAPKEESKKDYFTPDEKKPELKKVPAKNTAQPGKKSILPILLLVIIAAIAFIMWPRSVNGSVTEMSWERAIEVEAYRTVQESDWSVPEGGRTYKAQEEIHHYDSVFDHYETRYRQVSEQVYDGEDTHTSYTNNGDGTFTENTYTTPRYRTEYHTESYQEPIYRQVARYQTKYYYEIERWVYDRTVIAEGGADDPAWPDCGLADNECEGNRMEKYSMTVSDDKKSYTIYIDQDLWSKYKPGSKAKLTVVNGRVTELDGTKLN